jgi:hypothetical protein
MRWAVHVALQREREREMHRGFCWGNLNERDHLAYM